MCFKHLYKKIFSLALILCLTIPANAAVSVSDGSAFVSKAEFSTDITNLSNRMAQLENSLDAKIDSLVSSYLSRNGIWNGEAQSLSSDLENWVGLIKNGRYPSVGEWKSDKYSNAINAYLNNVIECSKSGLLFLKCDFSVSSAANYWATFLVPCHQYASAGESPTITAMEAAEVFDSPIRYVWINGKFDANSSIETLNQQGQVRLTKNVGRVYQFPAAKVMNVSLYDDRWYNDNIDFGSFFVNKGDKLSFAIVSDSGQYYCYWQIGIFLNRGATYTSNKFIKLLQAEIY